jgi:septum formation protein
LSETIVLASGSATRLAILRSAGLSFLSDPANVDESAIKIDCAACSLDAAATAQRLAIAKAEAVAPRHAGSIVLGADQMLSCDGKWFDKPSDRMAAATQIMQLSGKTHQLISAICAIRDETLLWTATQTAEMTMRPLSGAFIESYLDQEDDLVLNSVGGYRIEGRGVQLFSDIQGDYFTILGLPLLPLLSFLRERGVLHQ